MSDETADLLDLSGKVAIVTGGSRGLGRAISAAFFERGASVVIASRKSEACEALADELNTRPQRRNSADAVAMSCHVGKWHDCDRLIATVVDRFGHLDVLVNNAGMSPLYPSLGEVSEELFDKVIGVNLKGPFRLSALAAEYMREHDGGKLIAISSAASVKPTANQVPYAVAKAGLNTLVVAIAHMFGPTVRSNGIIAGPFLTDVSEAWDPNWMEQVLESIPLHRAGMPDEIVGAALYLASDASSFTTGTLLKVDGGAAWSQ